MTVSSVLNIAKTLTGIFTSDLSSSNEIQSLMKDIRNFMLSMQRSNVAQEGARRREAPQATGVSPNAISPEDI